MITRCEFKAGIDPHIGLWADSAETALHPLSSSLYASPLFILYQKIFKKKSGHLLQAQRHQTQWGSSYFSEIWVFAPWDILSIVLNFNNSNLFSLFHNTSMITWHSLPFIYIINHSLYQILSVKTMQVVWFLSPDWCTHHVFSQKNQERRMMDGVVWNVEIR